MSESEERQQTSSAGVSDYAEQIRLMDRDLSDAERIDLLRSFEQLKSTCAAAQAKLAADLDRSRRAERAAAGVPTDHQGRGIAAEVALARRESPHRGGQHLGFAQALVHEMPHTLTLLERGVISEWRATILVRETACLTREDRTAVDAELCSDPSAFDGMGDRTLTALVRKHAAERDAEAMVRRSRKAVADRRVSTRPAPDTMAYLTALLPVAEAVAVQAKLGRDADSVRAAGDERTRAQIMADLLVQRVAGIDPARGPKIVVNLVISDRTLLAGGSDPAHVEGFGPIPPEIAREWIRNRADSDGPTAADSFLALRKLYADPGTGALTAMESQARAFPTSLGRFIDIRDRICRTPWCDAPIRHHDHIRDHAKGGKTSAANAAGLCEACNHAKQGEGWRVEPEPNSRGHLHSYVIKTPAGQTYRSTAPPLPQPLDLTIEVYRPAETILIDYLIAA